MSVKIDYICPFCNKNHVKDYAISGDYNEDGQLLSFCPVCGRMYKVKLTQNQRKLIAVRLSMRCKLDFNETKQVTQDAPEEIFAKYVKKSLNILREDIIAVMEHKKHENRRKKQ